MTNGCSVMIVDDDDGVRESLALALADEGRQILCARNGREALSQLETANPLPCLIFLDLMMPVMDGRSFRVEQVKDERLSAITVVVATAGDVPEEIAGLPILRKPFEIEQLVSMLGDCPRHVSPGPPRRGP